LPNIEEEMYGKRRCQRRKLYRQPADGGRGRESVGVEKKVMKILKDP
jgi:hypothetical protein